MIALVLLLAMAPVDGGGVLLAKNEKNEKKETAKKAQSKKERVLVLDVGGGALAKEEAGVLRDALAKEFARKAKAEVMSSEDVRRVADIAAEKQTVDCDTEACLAEIGAAMGASRVLHGSVVRLGERYVMSLSLVDPDNARSLGRATAKGNDVDKLLATVPVAVAEVLGEPVPQEEEVRGRGFPLLTVSGAVVTTLAVVATAAGGGTLVYLFQTTQQPDGPAQLKQAFLDYGQPLGIATAVSGGVVVVGSSVFVIGLLVE